jgi:glycosyltransferase involved in cell wall biosynthesis
MVNRKPLVSIVICFLDAGYYLEEAITSVFRQSYEQWELILVNDGSSDESEAIALSFVQKRPDQVRYLTHKGALNKGLSPSRNLGIAQANGEYVCFLDADDVFLEHKLREQVMLMEQMPEADLMMESTLYWYSWNGGGVEDIRVDIGVPKGLYAPPALITQLYPLGSGQAPCVSSLMVRANAISRIGTFSNDFIGAKTLFEDQAFLCQYYLNGSVYISDGCNSMYRQREDSCVPSVKRQGLYREVRFAYFIYLRKKMKILGYQGTTLMSLVNREILRLNPLFHRIKMLLNWLRP